MGDILCHLRLIKDICPLLLMVITVANLQVRLLFSLLLVMLARILSLAPLLLLRTCNNSINMRLLPHLVPFHRK